MLASSQAGDEPSAQAVLDIAPMQKVDSMLGDLQGGGQAWETTGTGIPGTGANGSGPGGGAGADATDPMNSSLGSNPRDRIQDPDSPYYKGKNRGGSTSTPIIIPSSSDDDEPTPEPHPYWLQGL